MLCISFFSGETLDIGHTSCIIEYILRTVLQVVLHPTWNTVICRGIVQCEIYHFTIQVLGHVCCSHEFLKTFLHLILVLLIQIWGLFSSLWRLPKNAHQNIVNNLNYLGLMIELEVFPVCSGRSKKIDSWTAAVIQRPKCGPLSF